MKIVTKLKESDSKKILRTFAIVSILLLDVKLADGRNFPPASLILFALTLTIFSVWWFLKLKARVGLPRTPISLPLITLIIVAILSTLFSIDPRRSLDSTLAILTLVFIFFLICDLILFGWQREIFELALLIFVGCLLLLGLMETLGHYWYWFNIQVPEYPLFLLRYRLFGVAAHPNLFAMLVYITLPFAIFRLVRSKTRINRIIWIIWILLATFIFFFINSRGGVLGASFALLVTLGWILFKNGFPTRGTIKYWFRKNRNIFSGIFIYLLIFISLFIVFQYISPQTETLRHGGGISAGRLKFWQVAINMFQQNPLTGSGLSTYPRFYYEELPTMGWIAAHAHNLYLDVMAQIGIIGALVLLWIILTILISFIRSIFTKHSMELEFYKGNKDLLVGALAAFIGFSIHSLVDVVILTPHTIIPLSILIAIGFSSANMIHQGQRLNSSILPALVGISFIVAAIAFTIIQNFAHVAQIKSKELANQNNWLQATKSLEQAKYLDPYLFFYHEQLGFANGVLSELENDENALKSGLLYYSTTLQKQPFWAPNYLNYSSLLKNNQEFDKSLQILESIPSNWLTRWHLPAFMLGERYEENLEYEKAADFFRLGLKNRPWLKDIFICMRSAICQEVAGKMISDNEIYHIHNEAISLMEDGETEEALRTLEQLPYTQIPPILWIDLAAAHISLGDYELAVYELNIADELGAMRSDETRSYLVLVISELLTKTNKFESAISVLNVAVKPENVYRVYDYSVFQRAGFSDMLLPSIKLLNMNKYDQQIFEKLSDLYQLQGRYSEANWANKQAKSLSQILEGN